MMCGLIDLNTINDDSDDVTTSLVLESPSQSPSLSDSYASPATSCSPVVCSLELWHACAGPLISLPKKGNAVVYLPQGHLEQQRLNYSPAIAGARLPPHVFCRVVDVKLHAETGTDDVFAQVSLVPDPQLVKKWCEAEVEEDDNGGLDEKSSTPHMFCKTLTASDTSTHGGFSVPRRAAEDCFPPLDYNQQRPSQEIVAKDLHGTEWKFRHIYRGQPRRHLLTTGWSAFINKKKLVCGDAVLFLRGDDGVLRLGVRRVVQLKTAPGFPATSVQPPSDFDFSMVVNSISRKTVFNVCYNPRGGLSDFILPYRQFMKSVANNLLPGMRFNLRFETEDAGERKCTGIITGISDVDPVNFPGSKWRSLMVRWDGMEVTRQNRVSPWEIKRCNSVSGSNNILSPIAKRIRNGFPTIGPDFQLPKDGSERRALDLEKSMRFQKVLQGQEIYGYNHFYGAQNHHPIKSQWDAKSTILNSNLRNLIGNGINHGESFRSNEVLQGQEIVMKPQTYNNFSQPFIHSPSSVLSFQNAIGQPPYSRPMNVTNGQHNSNNQQEIFPVAIGPQESVFTSKSSCRLFGFSLTEGTSQHTLRRPLENEDFSGLYCD